MLVEGQILIDRLEHWAEAQPARPAWSFLDERGDVEDAYTYEELNNSATALGNHLVTDNGIKPGDRVLLVFFPGLDFTVSLLACFKVGIIAVPVFPPDPRKLKKDLHHFVSVQSSSGSTVCLTHGDYSFAKKMAGAKNLFSMSGHSWPDMTWIQVDKILSKNKKVATKMQVLKPAASSLAFLQYTSGSTSEPKGVMISHENLAHNLVLISTELKTTPQTVEVSWLPQYHDMGLIGSYLGCLYCGGSGYYLSPITFLKDPTSWPRALGKFKASHTQAPNFAYALVVRKWKSLKSKITLDLTAVEHMINAAEPVDASAIQEFYAVFGPYGLKPGVVVPTYGLAEHCVFVCSGGKQMLTVSKEKLASDEVEMLHHDYLDTSLAAEKESANSAAANVEGQTIVGCGYPGKGVDVDVCIVNTETRVRLQVTKGSRTTVDGDTYGDINTQVGEIWVNSASKAQGYWNLPAVTAEEFQAKVVGEETAAKTYLRTGDLGFFYRGELFICGRLKDLIIIRGSNHYPQDIEKTAETFAADYLRAGCSAAFSIKTTENTTIDASEAATTETLVYVAELKPEALQLAKAQKQTVAQMHVSVAEMIRTAIVKEHGLSISTLCLLDPRTVPKTTSGKITRKGCQKALDAGTLSIVYRWNAPPGYVETIGSSASAEMVEVELTGEATTSIEAVTAAGGALPFTSQAELMALPVRKVQELVQDLLIAVCDGSPAPQTAPVDLSASLLDLGLDSMTIAQFKGALDSQFYTAGAKRVCAAPNREGNDAADDAGDSEETPALATNSAATGAESAATGAGAGAGAALGGIPDDFMFTNLATLEALSLAVQRGGLTSEQRRRFEDALAGVGGNDGEEMAEIQRQPMCPWFYICC